jgi:hypothetical protein
MWFKGYNADRFEFLYSQYLPATSVAAATWGLYASVSGGENYWYLQGYSTAAALAADVNAFVAAAGGTPWMVIGDLTTISTTTVLVAINFEVAKGFTDTGTGIAVRGSWCTLGYTPYANYAAARTAILGITSTANEPVHNVRNHGAVGDGVTDDHLAFQSAVNAASTAGGGVVYIPEGSYYIGSRVTPQSTTIIQGAGMNTTTLISGVAFDYVFYTSNSGSGIQDFTLRDLTVNVNNVSHGAGIRFEYATRILVERVHIQNVSNGWGAVIGAPGATSTYINTDIKFRDCFFDTQNSTLEMLLIMNTQHAEVINCKFYNQTASSGPGLGIYQVCDDIQVSHCIFSAISGPAIYYSLSCNNITIDNCAFYGVNGGTGVQGTNLSDNGAFGYGYVYGLSVTNCYFTGLAVGLQLGATKGALVDTCNFDSNYNIAIFLNAGNQGVSALAKYWTIANCRFRNNNQQGTNGTIHPAIFFSTIAGSMYGKLTNCSFWDDGAGGVNTQFCPISFYGPGTWDYIKVTDCYIEQHSTTNVNQQLFLVNSALLGSNVAILNSTYSTGTVTIPVNAPNQLKGFSVAMGIALG